MAKRSPREAYVDLSLDELAALSLGADVDLVAIAAAASTAAALAGDPTSGRASLLDRAFAANTEGSALEIAAPISTILDVLARPALVARVARASNGSEAVRQYFAVPDLAVEQEPLPERQYRFTPFETENLLVRILDFAMLFDWPAPLIEPFELPEDAISAMSASLGDIADEALARRLDDAGAPQRSIDALARAYASGAATLSVALLHRPGEHVFEGGELTWVDGGEAGLWILEDLGPALADRSDHAPTDHTSAGISHDLDTAIVIPSSIRVIPATAAHIAEELFSYLPQPADA